MLWPKTQEEYRKIKGLDIPTGKVKKILITVTPKNWEPSLSDDDQNKLRLMLKEVKYG